MFPLLIVTTGGRSTGVLTTEAFASAGVQLLLMRIE